MHMVGDASHRQSDAFQALDDSTHIFVEFVAPGCSHPSLAILRAENQVVVESQMRRRHARTFLALLPERICFLHPISGGSGRCATFTDRLGSSGPPGRPNSINGTHYKLLSPTFDAHTN